MIRLGDHVVVRGEDEEAIVTAVHPDSQVEVEYLHVADGGHRGRRYSAEALEVIERGHGCRAVRNHSVNCPQRIAVRMDDLDKTAG